MGDIISESYKIANKYGAILYGNTTISGDVNILIFGFECDSTLFYKNFIKITKDTFSVNTQSKKALKEIKKLLKRAGYRKVWFKGVLSIYGDLRPLAVKAGFGKWGSQGIIENEIYGSNFLIAAVFYRDVTRCIPVCK